MSEGITFQLDELCFICQRNSVKHALLAHTFITDEHKRTMEELQQLRADRDRLMGMVNSAENRARLAEDREELLKAALLRIAKDATGFFEDSPRAIAWAALDAQEPRT